MANQETDMAVIIEREPNIENVEKLLEVGRRRAEERRIRESNMQGNTGKPTLEGSGNVARQRLSIKESIVGALIRK